MNVSACQQFSCSLQFVNASIVPRNVFSGFYTVTDSKEETLFQSVKDMLTRLNLHLFKLQGYCFDGVSNTFLIPPKIKKPNA